MEEPLRSPSADEHLIATQADLRGTRFVPAKSESVGTTVTGEVLPGIPSSFRIRRVWREARWPRFLQPARTIRRTSRRMPTAPAARNIPDWQ